MCASSFQVNFSEPLSMLQRLSEDFEYSECLDNAARCEDSCEQVKHTIAIVLYHSVFKSRSTLDLSEHCC